MADFVKTGKLDFRDLVTSMIADLAKLAARRFILGPIANALSGVPFVGGFLQNLAQDSAVFGKILVLCVIILFLQWRPSGLFAARSRSLD